MIVYAIVIENHQASEDAFHRLLKSSVEMGNEFDIQPLWAITPDNVEEKMKEYGLVWNWPDRGVVMDPDTGLRKHAYGGPPKQRWACLCLTICFGENVCLGTNLFSY